MYILIGILLPWLLFFMLGRTMEGIICLILQLTVLGWLPAAIWALVTLHRSRPSSARPKADKPGK
ncbi:MAG: YqaE/Pmp3 family membrane protein [Sneathiella sp.]|uniref:YqaE/Pmp3 family membrane protein n=1 Tax=Sneathiella sp. TaxID=1964365 RepID=UPI000C69E48C|nr:YqaE/Pmp3 family membrane protein [Sneathiella sp.]MAZ01741.1 YqaE/Pmp3 family membrane protein [Sneathiella sp.]